MRCGCAAVIGLSDQRSVRRGAVLCGVARCAAVINTVATARARPLILSLAVDPAPALIRRCQSVAVLSARWLTDPRCHYLQRTVVTFYVRTQLKQQNVLFLNFYFNCPN